MDFDHSIEVITLDTANTLTIQGTGSIVIPNGTTAQQPAAGIAQLRYDTTTNQVMWSNASSWNTFASASDQYVKISATDTTANYLQPKLIAGTGITIVKSAAGNETLTLSNSGAVIGDQAAIQISTTAPVTMTTTLTDIIFNISDVLNNSAILNWVSGVSISVGQTGPYLIYYNAPNVGGGGTRTITFRVRKNTATVLNGGTTVSTFANSNNPDMSCSFVAILTAGDTLQLQVSDSRTGEVIPAGVTFGAIRLTAATGSQGAQGNAGAAGPTGSGTNINVYDESIAVIGTPFSILNFTGAGVVATAGSGGTVNISIPGGTAILKSYTYYPGSMDNPINASWVINALAPMVSDPTYGAFNVRQFNDTTEQGVGCYFTIPAGANNVTLKFKGRAQTAGGAVRSVQLRLYSKSIPDAATVGSWSSPLALTTFSIPNDALYHYYSQVISLASLGMTANTLYQLEITRTSSVTSGTNLTGNWLMIEMTYEFT